jgi:hypothetical protein
MHARGPIDCVGVTLIAYIEFMLKLGGYLSTYLHAYLPFKHLSCPAAPNMTMAKA